MRPILAVLLICLLGCGGGTFRGTFRSGSTVFSVTGFVSFIEGTTLPGTTIPVTRRCVPLTAGARKAFAASRNCYLSSQCETCVRKVSLFLWVELCQKHSFVRIGTERLRATSVQNPATFARVSASGTNAHSWPFGCSMSFLWKIVAKRGDHRPACQVCEHRLRSVSLKARFRI